MTIEPIEKSIKILQDAIDKNISVKASCLENGYSGTYVKNVKMHIKGLKRIPEEINEPINKFKGLYLKYSELMNGKPNQVIENPKPIQNKPDNDKLTVKIDGNNGEIDWTSGSNYPVNHVKTLDQLLEITNVDKRVWKVKEYTVNKWDTTSWRNKEPQTIQNFQVKARLERDLKTFREKEIGELFNEMIINYSPKILPITIKEPSKENNLFEVSIWDLHLGKLAHFSETGEDYNIKIASERFLSAIQTLIHRASGFNYNKILFPIGSDFFNSDTISNTTTAGTPQDEDMRWQKTFTYGVQLLVDGIEMLKQTGVDVDVVVIPGNHDFERSYYMGAYLSAWYKNDENVSVNNGASPRKYYKFGKVLLGLTHGNEEKEASLPMLMASECKSDWGDTNHHVWHLGHIHRRRDVKYTVLDKSKTLSEDLGVTVAYLSSLSGTESWHHKKGYTSCAKAGNAFIWNDENGLIAQLNSNIKIE